MNDALRKAEAVSGCVHEPETLVDLVALDQRVHVNCDAFHLLVLDLVHFNCVLRSKSFRRRRRDRIQDDLRAR